MRISDWSSDVCSSDLCSMPIYIVQEHWPVTQAVERAIEAPSPAAALEALRTLRDRDPDWYASQRSCENSDGHSTFAVWDEAMISELLVETPSTGPDPPDEALDALQAALDDADRKSPRPNSSP